MTLFTATPEYQTTIQHIII